MATTSSEACFANRIDSISYLIESLETPLNQLEVHDDSHLIDISTNCTFSHSHIPPHFHLSGICLSIYLSAKCFPRPFLFLFKISSNQVLLYFQTPTRLDSTRSQQTNNPRYQSFSFFFPSTIYLSIFYSILFSRRLQPNPRTLNSNQSHSNSNSNSKSKSNKNNGRRPHNHRAETHQPRHPLQPRGSSLRQSKSQPLLLSSPTPFLLFLLFSPTK